MTPTARNVSPHALVSAYLELLYGDRRSQPRQLMMPPALSTLSRSNLGLAIHAFASNGDYILTSCAFQGFASPLQARLVVVSGGGGSVAGTGSRSGAGRPSPYCCRKHRTWSPVVPSSRSGQGDPLNARTSTPSPQTGAAALVSKV
jgi:hypothetical protein